MTDRYTKGMEVFKEHLGEDAEKYISAIREVSPLFARVNVEFAFGDIYGNPARELDEKTQELVTLGALTVLGNALPELKLHICCALHVGATKEEITEVITQMIAYCGFPAATHAIMVAKEVFKEKGIL
jgi:4-carboxymuconolactone decarboxylase